MAFAEKKNIRKRAAKSVNSAFLRAFSFLQIRLFCAPLCPRARHTALRSAGIRLSRLVLFALSMIREILFGVGFALLLPLFFGLDGVLYSMPLSDLLTFLIALVLILRTDRELKAEA